MVSITTLSWDGSTIMTLSIITLRRDGSASRAGCSITLSRDCTYHNPTSGWQSYDAFVPSITRFSCEQSSVTWRTLIYTVVKNMYQVEHCTHITLREIQVVMTRFNRWVRSMLGELHMLSISEKDLETHIGPPAATYLLVKLIMMFTMF